MIVFSWLIRIIMRYSRHMSGEDPIKTVASAAAGEAKKMAMKDAVNIAKLIASAGSDVSAWWGLIKRWGGRIIKLIIALILVFIQILAASSTAAAECGGGGGQTDAESGTPGYATTKGGNGEDMAIVKIAYDEVKKRYGTNPDGNRVLLTVFEVALAESHFQNLGDLGDKNDHTSLGVMQQQDSWGSVSQRTNPTWAINKFMTVMEGYRKAHPSIPAYALAQDTQRSWCDNSQPPEAMNNCHGIYGGNYLDQQKRATELINQMGGFFTTTGTAGTQTGAAAVDTENTSACDGAAGNIGNLSGKKNVPMTSKSPMSGTHNFVIDLVPDGQRGLVISAAFTQLGVRYVFGSDNWADVAGEQGAMLDCSSLTMGALKRGSPSINVVHQAEAQYYALRTKYSSPDQMKPGDLIFYSDASDGRATNIHHVAIYLGWGTMDGSSTKVRLMIAAPETGDVVKIQPYYTEHKGSNLGMFWGDPGYTA